MPVATREAEIYRSDAMTQSLTPAEREKLLAVSSQNLCHDQLYNKNSTAISSHSPFTVALKTEQNKEYSQHTAREPYITFKTRSPEVLPKPVTRSGLCYSTHDLLGFHTVSPGISCGEGQDICYFVLPPPDAWAYSERCQGIVTVTAALECYTEA